MKPPLRLSAALLVVTVLSVSASQSPAPDLIIVNARVFTGESSQFAEAISVRGERIAAIGSTAAIRPAAGPSTRIIDAAGRLVIPGINDAHVHPSALPPHTPVEGPPAVEQDPTLAQVLARVKAAAGKAPEDGWIIGEIGATVLFDPAATRFAVDQVSGGRPVMLASWHGHGSLFNTAALRALGIGDIPADPPGGRYVRGADGTITGMVEEYADVAVRRRVTSMPGDGAQVEALQRFAREAASFGITSVQAMMTALPVERASTLVERAQLPVRMRVIDFPLEAPGAWRASSTSGVKYVVDGTPVERLMFLREPYHDAPSTRGRLNFTEGDLRGFAAAVGTRNVQPMFHATGDATIDAVLAALEGQKNANWTARRPRLEHADMFGREHVDRARRLGVIVVQNPSHFMIAPLLKARLGTRANGVMAVKSIARTGVPLAFGSDGPLNPFLNMMFAAMHPANPSEALTVQESLVAYTRGSAFAEFAEGEKGTLAPGKLADFAVLSQDIFAVPPSELPKTTSVLTVVGGRIVHESK